MRRLKICWSNLLVSQGGSAGPDGRPRAYSGSAAPAGELELAPLFHRMFNYVVPGVDEQPGLLRKILLSDVTVEAAVSPLTTREIDRTCSVVSFGSPGYNVVSAWIEDQLHSPGRCSVDDRPGIFVPGVEPFTDLLVGFVQRIRIGDGPAVAFYTAGRTEQATKAAAYFLASRWRYLRGRFGNRENFCVVLKADPGDHRRHTILLECGEP